VLLLCKKNIKKTKKKNEASSTGSQLQKPPQFSSCCAQKEPKNNAINVKIKLIFFKNRKKAENDNFFG